MDPQINYTRQELTALKSQIEQQTSALGSLLNSVRQAESLLDAREALGEKPVRENIEAKFTALNTAVASVNALSLSIPSQVDFMAGYDAATDPE